MGLVVVATLGDVLRYRYARYRPNTWSFLSLKYFEERKPEKYVVVALESILRSTAKFAGDKLPEHVEAMLNRRFRHVRVSKTQEGAVDVSPHDVREYRDWVDGVREYYLAALSEALEGLDESRVEVIVLPAQAENWYGYRYALINRDAYMAILLGSLYRVLKGHAGGLQVALDVTHGLNFVIPLVFEALRVLAPLFKAKVYVYNAIPVSSDMNEYEVVETYKVNGDRSTLDLSFMEKSKINDPVVRSIYRAIVLNAPLALYYLCGCWPSAKEKACADAYEAFVGGRRVAGNTLEGGDIRLSPQAVMACILADWACSRVGTNEVKDMHRWAPEIYGVLGEAPKAIVMHELNDLWHLAEKLEDGSRKLLHELRGEKPEDFASESDELKRNFVAHAGFLKEIVALRKEGGKLYAEYECNSALRAVMENLGIDLSCALGGCREKH